jgi:hypothetical protein
MSSVMQKKNHNWSSKFLAHIPKLLWKTKAQKQKMGLLQVGVVFCRWVFCSADGFSSSADGCCANAGISRAGAVNKMKNPQQQQKRNSQQIQKNQGVSSRRGKQKARE